MKKSYIVLIVLLCVVVVASCVLLAVFLKKSADQPDQPDQPTTRPVTVSLDKTENTLPADEEFYLTVTTDSKGFVTWSSSDKTVASVDSQGRVLTKKAGVATITATVGDVSATCRLIVTEAVTQNGAKLLVDELCILSLQDGAVKLHPEYVEDGTGTPVTDKPMTYRSSDESVVTVSEDGTVTPVSLGVAVIVVECEGIKSSVVADVYTAGISTPEEWLSMIVGSCHYPEKLTTTDRFYLKNDIDFAGVEYDIGQTARGATSHTDNPYHFGSEINGNFHTVKNITQWKADPENPDDHQSIFGKTIGAKVRNIAFENVVFDSTNSYGLSSVMMHHMADPDRPSEKIVVANQFENISADFIYDFDPAGGKGSMAVGVTPSAYGVNLKNVFIRMRTHGAESLTDKYNNVYGFAHAEWVWYGGSLSNVIILMEDVPMGGARFIDDDASDPVYKHLKTNCYAVNTVIQAVYYANQCFDQTVWDVTDPTVVPAFLKK